jgi:hypothetical protein
MRRGGALHDQQIAETLVVSLLMKMGAVFVCESGFSPAEGMPEVT